MKKRVVAIGEKGKRVGEDHGRARLTNHEVELIRALHAAGMGYKQLAGKFEVGVRTIRDIVHLRKRATAAMGWKTVGCA